MSETERLHRVTQSAITLIPEFLPDQHDCEPGNCTPECEYARRAAGEAHCLTCGTFDNLYDSDECFSCRDERLASGQADHAVHNYKAERGL